MGVCKPREYVREREEEINVHNPGQGFVVDLWGKGGSVGEEKKRENCTCLYATYLDATTAVVAVPRGEGGGRSGEAAPRALTGDGQGGQARESEAGAASEAAAAGAEPEGRRLAPPRGGRGGEGGGGVVADGGERGLLPLVHAADGVLDVAAR